MSTHFQVTKTFQDISREFIYSCIPHEASLLAKRQMWDFVVQSSTPMAALIKEGQSPPAFWMMQRDMEALLPSICTTQITRNRRTKVDVRFRGKTCITPGPGLEVSFLESEVTVSPLSFVFK